MCVGIRHLAALLAAALCSSVSWPALAWVETTTRACVSTVEVAADGLATVSHEIGLDVRGGPLRKLELLSADVDAEVFPDATVTRTSTGAVMPLVVERSEDGTLNLEIDHDRGLRSGRYLFRLRYKTNLRQGERLRQRGRAAEISWTGPRFTNGVGGVRAVFRLPPSTVPPALPVSSPGEPDVSFGVLLGEVRRTPHGDEIELLRSHVAKGEPVIWRIEANLALFPALGEAGVTPASDSLESVALPSRAPFRPTEKRSYWMFALGLGSFFAALVAVKSRGLARVALAAGARALRPFGLPLAVRAPAAGLALALAVVAGAELVEPLAAGFLLLLALGLASERTPMRLRAPRGPGRWLALADSDAFARRSSPLPGAWLDAGTLTGFLLFSLASLAVLGAAGLELARSPYHAFLWLLGGSVLLPLFFTGQGRALAGDRVAFSQGFVRGLLRRLRPSSDLRAVAWARVPDESGDPDELRLLVSPRNAKGGLVALEAGVEPERGLGGTLPAPFVIVRVREGSDAERALPRGLEWSRGRRPEERVAILKPKLPTVALTEALIRRLLELTTAQGGKSSRMSSGSARSTSNPVRVPSPAHAT